MRAALVTALCLVAGLMGLMAQDRPGALTIYYVDTEGGQSTLLLKVTAQQDGTFTVTNTRNRFSKTYRPR